MLVMCCCIVVLCCCCGTLLCVWIVVLLVVVVVTRRDIAMLLTFHTARCCGCCVCHGLATDTFTLVTPAPYASPYANCAIHLMPVIRDIYLQDVVLLIRWDNPHADASALLLAVRSTIDVERQLLHTLQWANMNDNAAHAWADISILNTWSTLCNCRLVRTVTTPAAFCHRSDLPAMH